MRLARLLRLLLAISVFALAGVALRGYVTDDTFIHLRYASNLVERGEFSFNPGQPTYGATSVIWVLALAFLLKIGLPPMFAAWALGTGCGLGVILVADAIVSRLTFPERWKTLVLLLVVCDVWFLRWTFSGMETPLATLMLLVCMWPLFADMELAWLSAGRSLWPQFLAWGAAAGLAGLVRPEYLVVAPAALPVFLWFEYFRAGSQAGRPGRWRARPYAPLAAAATGWFVVVGPWLVFALVVFGRITPGTATAKSSGLVLAPVSLVTHLMGSLKQLAVTQGLLWVGLVGLMILVLVRHQLATIDWDPEDLPLTIPPVEGERQGVGPWSVWGPVAVVSTAVTWTVVLLTGLAVKNVWVISRYVSPLGPVLIVAMSVMAEWLMSSPVMGRRFRLGGRTIIILAAAGTFTINGWVFLHHVVPHARTFSNEVQTCYLDLGIRLKAQTPPDAVVAALDIGAVGFASDRRVLDLMGLVSPDIREIGREMGFQEMVATGAWVPVLAAVEAPAGQRYLVDRTDGDPRWAGRTVHGMRFDLLQTCTLHGVGLRETQPWTVALYRLVSTETGFRSSGGG